MRVGRKRSKDLHLLPGVREIDGRWYWQPTKATDRKARKKAGLKASVPLGEARSEAALKKWAELSGYRDEPGHKGTVLEITTKFRREGIQKKLNGKPRSAKTIREYENSLDVMEGLFGKCRYGKTAAEAMAGKAIGAVDLQRFITEDGRPIANRHVSALSAAFSWAISVGLTAYNPCRGAVKTAEEPRTREPQEWEVECLLAVADAAEDVLMGLMVRFERICGWRVSDIRRCARPQLTPRGVKHRHGKRGKRQLWAWSDELSAIVAAALERQAAEGSMLVFPADDGTELTLDAFEKRWWKLKRATNEALAACEIPLAIEDLHFQDLRSMAGDDAEEQGQDRATFLGNSKAVAERHYARREQKVRPIR